MYPTLSKVYNLGVR